jgi:hypothetical protein
MQTAKPMQEPWFKRGFEDFKENYDNYLTIFFGVGIAVYSFVGGSPGDPKLFAAITGLIALIAVSLIRDRKDKKELKEAAVKLIRPPSATDVLVSKYAYRPFTEIFENAEEILMVGASFSNVIGGIAPLLNYAICNHQASVKIIILDEKSPVILSAARCIGTKEVEVDGTKMSAVRVMKEEIQRTKVVIHTIAQNTLGMEGSIELRQMMDYPNYSMTIINPTKPNGYMTFEPIGYKKGVDECPHLVLTKKDDPNWFGYYYNQFNQLWKDSH